MSQRLLTLNNKIFLFCNEGCTPKNDKEDFVQEENFLHHRHLSFLDNNHDETRQRIEKIDGQ